MDHKTWNLTSTRAVRRGRGREPMEQPRPSKWELRQVTYQLCDLVSEFVALHQAPLAGSINEALTQHARKYEISQTYYDLKEKHGLYSY